MPLLNTGHPLVKGLILDVSFFERGGTAPIELISKVKASFSGAPAWITNIYGSALSFAGGVSTDTVDIGIYTPTVQKSIEVLFYTVATDATNRRIWEWNNIDFIQFNSTNLIYAMNWSTTIGQWPLATSPSIGRWHTILITYDGSSTTNDAVIYLDGNIQPLGTIVRPVGTLNSGADHIRIGNRSAGDRTWNGYFGYYRRWNRIINAQEAKQLASNPFQIYTQPGLTYPFR